MEAVALRTAYDIPQPLPWASLAGPLAATEDALARLDERLAHSPIRQGWVARTHFADACACLWLEGDLVMLEDLVLHDAAMDVRAPTHEVTRAHAMLRTRRRIADQAASWALSRAGLDALRGRATEAPLENRAPPDAARVSQPASGPDTGGDADLDGLFASLDAAIASAERTLAGQVRPSARKPERAALVYDPDWDEDARLSDWRFIVDQTSHLPPVMAAAIAADAWEAIAPLQHGGWLGRLLASSLLRARGKTKSHLACLHLGMRAMPRDQRLREGPGLALQIAAIAAAAETGLKDHDRWLTAHSLLRRKLSGRRSTSHLPALVDYVMATPMVSAGMIAKELKITARAAQSLVAELGLREVTGRGSYRAWGIL